MTLQRSEKRRRRQLINGPYSPSRLNGSEPPDNCTAPRICRPSATARRTPRVQKTRVGAGICNSRVLVRAVVKLPMQHHLISDDEHFVDRAPISHARRSQQPEHDAEPFEEGPPKHSQWECSATRPAHAPGAREPQREHGARCRSRRDRWGHWRRAGHTVLPPSQWCDGDLDADAGGGPLGFRRRDALWSADRATAPAAVVVEISRSNAEANGQGQRGRLRVPG